MALHLSSSVVGDSNDETSFPHKLLLTNTQFQGFVKIFANSSPANIKFQKVNYLRWCI